MHGSRPENEMRPEPMRWEDRDFDEMIANGALDASIGGLPAPRFETLERDFQYALRHDVELLIELARAAAEAHEQAERHQEEERAALDPATDPDEAARMRRSIERRRKLSARARAIAAESAAQEATDPKAR